ncbi:MAG: AAA family ATPase [Candidatus Omnitrophica bacterium]|nr:AAA family ATPase [Candidatus Omnitrophota bacterium]
MYKDFFSLKDFPFGMAPDPAYFYPSKRHQEALDCLLYTIAERKGFCVVTGPVGSGKTTLCRTFMSRLDADSQIAMITHTLMTSKQLIMSILTELEIPYDERSSKTTLLNRFNEFLIETFAQNRHVVLVIDEAQNLTPSLLEEVRLLSNLETEREKLIQIILLGQPELYDKLCQHRLRQLRQRVALQVRLEGLTLEETRGYVRHRLELAGANGELDFTESAIRSIYEHSNGVPRLINLIGDAALLVGYATKRHTIDRPLIEEVVRDPMHNFALQHDRES